MLATPRATPVRARAIGALLPTLVTGLLVLGAGPAAAAPAPAPTTAASASPTATASIDPNSRTSVATAYQKIYQPALAVKAPAVPAGVVDRCDRTTPAPALQTANVDLVNFFRALSGVSPVTLDEDMSAKAQAAALISYANGSLDHYPDLDDKCFTVAGAEGASNSNLAKDFAGADVVRAYMDEAGAGNADAGHRWWLQQPGAKLMGSGNLGSYSALWIDGGTPAAAPSFTSWPANGYLPSALEPDGRWSLTSWGSGVDLSAATVKVTRADGSAVKVTTHPVGGYDSLVFELGDLPQPSGTTVDTYTVTVSGIRQDGQSIPAYRYQVKLFDASVAAPFDPASAPMIEGTTTVGSVLEAEHDTATGVTTAYQWYRGSNPIPGATQRNLVLASADVGARMRVEITRTIPDRATVKVSSTESDVVRASAVVTASATPTEPGALRLAVAVAAGSEPTDGGTVELHEGTKVVRRGIALSAGSARVDLTGLPAGNHTYTVLYTGATRVAPASSPVEATVSDRATATVSTGSSSTRVGTLTLTARVTAPGETGIGGTATIKEGSKTVRSGITVTDGKAVWSASGLSSGKHTYTVVYSGTPRVKAATVTATATVKAKVKPSVALKGTSSGRGKVSIAATLKASGQTGLGGTVTVKEGSRTRKSGIKVKGGRASWSAAGVKAGKHTYTVSYSGTSQVSSGSAKVTVTVR